MTHRHSGLGVISVLGLVAVIYAITYFSSVPYSKLVLEFGSFAVGEFTQITRDGSLFEVVTNTLGIVILDLVVSVITGILVTAILGKSKSFALESLQALFEKGSFKVLTLLFLEEIFARWVFLGLLTKVFTGDLWFYVLAIVGNALWAGIHLYNYKDTREQSLLRVLPQFVSGFLLSFLYYKYGFWATLFSHVTFDAILFSMFKKQIVSTADKIKMAYYAVLAVITATLLSFKGLSILDLMPWLQGGEVVKIPGYGFWDYVWVMFALEMLFTLALYFLFLDEPSYDKDVQRRYLNPVLAFLARIMTLVIFFGLNWALSFFISELVTKVLVIVCILMLFAPIKSGSAFARSWFGTLPMAYLYLTAYILLGFWTALGMSMVFYILEWFPTLLSTVETD